MAEQKLVIVSLAEARLQGLTRYFTGRPCKRGHVCERLTSIRSCIECQCSHMAVYRDGNREKLRAYARAYGRDYRVRNQDACRAASRKYYVANIERKIAYSRKWQRDNPEKANAGSARWDKRNRGKCAAKWARYNAKKLQATPPWVDHGAIRAVYEAAARLTRETGIPHDVDHIVPLMGKLVCGLHVAWNLRVITATANRRKGNRS